MHTAEQRISDAIAFATRKHRGQWRKHSNAPYIVHPLKVIERLGSWGIDREEHWHVWTAAALHDVIEDCGVTPQVIKFGFGKKVRDLVQELTFRERRPGEHHDAWREAKREYLESFAFKSTDALVIKVADRLCNTEDYMAVASKWDYAKKYFTQAQPLFDLYDRHVERIDERYGNAVCAMIGVDIDHIRANLGYKSVFDGSE